MVKLIDSFSRLSPIKILLAGDLMLDSYTLGKVKRISPESPVPVLNVVKESVLAGGAGNVAINLKTLGCQVHMLSRVGHDQKGQELIQIIEKEGVHTEDIFLDPFYMTPVKKRMIAEGQQLLRVDYEETHPIDTELENMILERIPFILEGVNLVCVSDYGKGFLSDAILASLILEARSRNIPVIIDPKGIDFKKYKGATIIKPNLSEAYLGSASLPNESLDVVARKILADTEVEHVVITRSADGISVFSKDGAIVHASIPDKQVKEVKDVTGAGDTVMAILSLAVGNQFSLVDSLDLANLAASLSVEQLGCARISLEQIAERLFSFDHRYKIFDEQYLHVFRKILGNCAYSLISVDAYEDLSISLLKKLHGLSKVSKQQKVIVCIKNASREAEIVDLIAAWKDVDFVLLESLQVKKTLEFTSTQNISQLKN
ncbi:MAG: bifunctional heptose 7-phosphate kinase/heptose 1-phosphate adenyltransferase [Rhabdochlamydiaceae bacterium]